MSDAPTGAVRPSVRELVAYPIEHERVAIKLDANELGFELPASILAAFRAIHEHVDLRRYPEGHADRLVATLAQRWSVAPECVLVGNGSNEMIALVFAAFGGGGVEGEAPFAVIPTPSFGVYPIQARSHGWALRDVPLGTDFRLDPNAVLDAAAESQARMVVLASPNNPTGNAFERSAIEAILDGFAGPVIVDEAYQAFAGDSWLGAWARWPNLVVLRTLSKVGLAALRVGFLFADARLTGELRKAKLPFNLNEVSARLAETAIRGWSELEALAGDVARERERLARELRKIPGISVFPSDANFVLIRVPGNADDTWSRLLARGISVRNFGRKPALAGCLRVTVGKPTENDAFLGALAELFPA